MSVNILMAMYCHQELAPQGSKKHTVAEIWRGDRLQGELLARNKMVPVPIDPLKSGFSSIFSMVPSQFCNHSWQYTIYGFPSLSTQKVPSKVDLFAGK